MLRFGIVGTNFISEWFAAACARSGVARATAVYSRSLDRAQAFARAASVDDSFDDLDAMAASVDAVYVASPNRLHAEQAIRAVEAGRHVLVEKTMATSLDEIAAIFEAAERSGVVAMEAMRNVHSPAHAVVADALPLLGTLRQARIEKLQYSSRYDRFLAGERPNAFDPTLGNSALADIGVYCVQPALDWFGEPVAASGSSIRLANGFEGAGAMRLDYPGLIVDLAWSKISQGVAGSSVTGELGSLLLDDPGEPATITLLLRGADPEVLWRGPSHPQDTMDGEIADFADQVRLGRTDPRWRQLSLASRALMDAHLAG